jgi:amino acid transporter
MPQFEFYTFSEQNFYFLSAFCAIYFFVVFIYLPYTSEILKMRRKLKKKYGFPTRNAKPINIVGLFIDIYLNRKINLDPENKSENDKKKSLEKNDK